MHKFKVGDKVTYTNKGAAKDRNSLGIIKRLVTDEEEDGYSSLTNRYRVVYGLENWEEWEKSISLLTNESSLTLGWPVLKVKFKIKI